MRKYSPFSQWYPSKFKIQKTTYNCAEQYMMYKKACLFNNHEIARLIMATNNPLIQKHLGRSIRNFNKDIWQNKCKAIIKRGNIAKFNQNKKLKKILMKTTGTTLVEWKGKWRDKNWLGLILAEIRNEFNQKKDWIIIQQLKIGLILSHNM
jgi:hypothetical protein